MLVNFFGKRGAGKTFTIKGQIQFTKRPCIVMDVLGNFDDVSGRHVDNAGDAILAMDEFISGESPEGLIIVKTSDPKVSVDFCSASLWEAETGGTLVLDEVDAFDADQVKCLDNLFRYGRNHGVDMITGCRRPFEIPRTITAGANSIYIFKTNEPRDIDYYAEIIGEAAYQLPNVEKYSGFYIDYDLDSKVGKFFVDSQGQIFHAGPVSVKD